MGGEPGWHPSVHSTPVDDPGLWDYIGIDCSDAFFDISHNNKTYEGQTFDEWRTFAGQAPKEPRLSYKNLILAGTMGGFVEPAFSFGITGALLSGKISAMAITDPEKAEKEFERFTGGIPTHMARKRKPGNVPTFKMGDVWFDIG